mgnify:CR=1 FL=1
MITFLSCLSAGVANEMVSWMDVMDACKRRYGCFAAFSDRERHARARRDRRQALHEAKRQKKQEEEDARAEASRGDVRAFLRKEAEDEYQRQQMRQEQQEQQESKRQRWNDGSGGDNGSGGRDGFTRRVLRRLTVFLQ